MKPERWQQLDRLFHSALELKPTERTAFLSEACAGDESLRRQIEALLAAHEEAGSFIERPAMEGEARGFAADEGTTEGELATGESFSHYRIIAPLGAGGMGQVYLAEDVTLGRKVALKLLPPDFTRDRDRVRRFQQEARAASALNHPNIITIHEIGQVKDRHFIATEFIDGETLRQHIAGSRSHVADDRRRTSGTPLKLRDILNMAIQTADALAAAHETGVVHRDIKPENIMVRRRDGYVKVLDFGLAKLTEGEGVKVDSKAPTRAQVQTRAGMVMGTASYMSPEQARGERVDSRTDIWSLGVVLYVMVAGCAPFERATASEVIALILERQPPPLARYAREVPSELERIVSKALSKDREERYQTAKDLLIDLRRLRQRLEVEAEIERFVAPPESSKAVGVAAIEAQAIATTGESRTRTDSVPARPASSAEYLVRAIKCHKTGAVVTFGALIIVAAAITFGWYKFTNRPRPNVGSLGMFQAIKIARLTSTGKVADAAISPDGKYVVHVVDDGGRQSLWMRQVATSSNVQIVPPADIEYGSLTFSRDGNYIYYLKSVNGGSELYQMPALGGAPRKLVADIDGSITFSPDGKKFAFVRGYPKESESALLVANADGTGEQKLAVRNGADFFFNAEEVGPSWSPDGKLIACPAGTLAAGGRQMSVFGVGVEQGVQKPLTSQQWLAVEDVAWLKDGNGLVVTAKEQASSPTQIWYLTYPGGEVRRITNDLNDYHSTSLTADSTALATVQSDVVSHIWVAPNGQASRASQVTSGKFDGVEEISWTPENKIVYSSGVGGNSDIWITDADGSNQKQLTVDAGTNHLPSVSPDGRYIIFTSNRAGNTNIWRMDIDGSSPKQLTNGSGENCPHFTPTGDWVVYNSFPGKVVLWKVPTNGGNPVQLTDKPSFEPMVSPDGKLIACNYMDEHLGWRTAIIPFAGGQPAKLFDIDTSFFCWTPDGRALAYLDPPGFLNIRSQPIDGTPSRQLTDFTSDRIFSFAWSRNGKQLALARGTLTNDVVLISGFREQH